MNEESKDLTPHEMNHVPEAHKPDYVPEKRDLLGHLAAKARAEDTYVVTAQEQGAQMTDNYVTEVLKTLEAGQKHYSGDFFIVVITKQEPTMINVLRNYFFYRASCPTPDYDQAVYHYKKQDDELVFLWVIPNRDFCFHIVDNILTLDEEYRELAKLVLDFNDGTLGVLAKKLNREDVLEGGVIMQILKEVI